MNYIDFTAGNKTYKLRLNTRNTVMLEKQLQCNPLNIFSDDGETIPTVTTMVAILNASLQQYNHGITLNDAYDIFDTWCYCRISGKRACIPYCTLCIACRSFFIHNG